nr:26S proteasome SU A5 [Cryptomonas sp.]
MNRDSLNEFSNFSPEGRLYQIEYALEAIRLGATVFGIRSNTGIVLVVEKKKGSKLIENKSIRKLVTLNNFIGCCISGLTSDGRLCVENIRIFLENNSFLYNNINDIEICAKKIRGLISSVTFGENGEFYINRPLGIAFLLCGLDRSGIRLFLIDPAGNFIEKKLAALGNGHKDAAFILREGYRNKMKTIELEKLAMKCIRVVIENQITEKDLELTVLDANSKKFLVRSCHEIKIILENI